MPLKTTTSFSPSPPDLHHSYPDDDHPFPADEISAFLHQLLLRHPPSPFYPPPPFAPQTQSVATLVPAGSSVLDPPFADNLVSFQGHFAGNEPFDQCEAGSEETPTKPPPRGAGSSTSKRTRAAEVHNLSEKRRRSRINEKMKALQKLIPNSNKTDKASMLDEAIEYLKQLQLQVQVLSMRNGVGLNQVSHGNIAESFLLQQGDHPLPGSAMESRLMNTKVQAVSAMDEQSALPAAAAARGVVFNVGRQSSNMTNAETCSAIRPSYVSY